MTLRSKDIQMMINHVNDDNDKHSNSITHGHSAQQPSASAATYTTRLAPASHHAVTSSTASAPIPATTATANPASSLTYDEFRLFLLDRDAREMRKLRELFRQHLTWRERLVEWSKFILNIVVAIIAVVVGIQTLQSRVSSVQTTVDALTGTVSQVSSSVSQVSGNVEKLSTSIKQSQQDVTTLQNNAAGLNRTIHGINGQLYDIQELSAQLAYNVTRLNVSQAIQQVELLDIRIDRLTNQSILFTTQLMSAQIQLQQQNRSTYIQLDQLTTTSQQQINSIVSNAQTNLTSYINVTSTIVTNLLQQQNQSVQMAINSVSSSGVWRCSPLFSSPSTSSTRAYADYGRYHRVGDRIEITGYLVLNNLIYSSGSLAISQFAETSLSCNSTLPFIERSIGQPIGGVMASLATTDSRGIPNYGYSWGANQNNKVKMSLYGPNPLTAGNSPADYTATSILLQYTFTYTLA